MHVSKQQFHTSVLLLGGCVSEQSFSVVDFPETPESPVQLTGGLTISCEECHHGISPAQPTHPVTQFPLFSATYDLLLLHCFLQFPTDQPL